MRLCTSNIKSIEPVIGAKIGEGFPEKYLGRKISPQKPVSDKQQRGAKSSLKPWQGTIVDKTC